MAEPFPWQPGSGAELSYDERVERIRLIRTSTEHLRDGDREWAATRALWLFVWARPNQIPPPLTDDWRFLFLSGGRGSGKTRAGAETIAGWAMSVDKSRWALVGPTLAHCREVMLEGDSGLLQILPREALWLGDRGAAYNSTRPELRLSNGARLRGFSSETPDRLRGPQYHGWWIDEPGSFADASSPPISEDNLNTTWANLQFGTRLKGIPNRGIVTGTPATVPILTGIDPVPGLLTGMDGAVIRRMSTSENAENLSDFYQDLMRDLDGTRLGRQELEGELLTDVRGALVRGAWIVVTEPPPLDSFRLIAIGVDPAGSHRESSDETGIIVAGLDQIGRCWVLADESGRYPPGTWRDIVADLYSDYRANAVVCEVNFGGDLVRSNLEVHQRPMHIVDVRASRGKALRFEPVAGLYEPRTDEQVGERIRHGGRFPQLEQQLTTWQPLGKNQASPDRMDAEVHVVTYLLDRASQGYDVSALYDDLGTY